MRPVLLLLPLLFACSGLSPTDSELRQVSRADGRTYPMIRFVSGSADWNRRACEDMRERMHREGPLLNWHCHSDAR